MSKSPKELLARATPEDLEATAGYAEAMARSIDLNPTTQNRVACLILLAALARAVAAWSRRPFFAHPVNIGTYDDQAGKDIWEVRVPMAMRYTQHDTLPQALAAIHQRLLTPEDTDA